MKRSPNRRRGLTIGAGCWWESTIQRTQEILSAARWPGRSGHGRSRFRPFASTAGRVRDATLALYDPTRRTTIRLAGARRPLAADFGAPLAYYPKFKLLGFMAMLRPANYENRAGLYMLEPYDPDRIPVVLIHGLTSNVDPYDQRHRVRSGDTRPLPVLGF